MLKGYFKNYVFVFFCIINLAHALPQKPKVADFENTIHGTVDFQEPVLKELCASPVMQRLKHIHQYGTYFISHPFSGGRTFTRYSHSLGVLKMLQLAKEKGAEISPAQMVAALLHDCSHTAFSHSTDVLFMGGYTKGAYQDKIHERFLRKYGILDIVKKYGFSLADILPDHPQHTALEQPTPNICADRLEYNLHSGYLTGLLTDQDRQAILADIRFENNQWYFTDPALAAKLARISLYNALHTWGSPASLLTGMHASKALKILVDQKIITLEDIKYNKNDDEIWKIMAESPIPEVRQAVNAILHIDDTFKIVNEGEHDMIVKGKFSGIDPFVLVNGHMMRLTACDPLYREEFLRTKEVVHRGRPIKFLRLRSSEQPPIEVSFERLYKQGYVC